MGRRRDEREDWEIELTRPDSHPLVAAIIGSVVILIVGVAIPTGSSLFYAVGATFATAVLVGGIAFAITIRHASHGWMVGSLAAIGAVALLAGIAALGRSNMAIRADMAALSEIRADEEGRMIVPPDMATRGPMSRLIATMARDLNDNLRTYKASLQDSGYPNLLKADYVAAHPGFVNDCDRFLSLKDAASHYQRQKNLRMQQALDRAGKLDLAPRVISSFRKGMELSRTRDAKALARTFDIERTLIDEAVAMCRILRRRHWVSEGDRFMFTSRAELTEFQAHATRFDELGKEQSGLNERSRATLEQGRERIRRSLDNPNADRPFADGR
ncbi:hypothetical protein U1769_10130 [Sphingomonas sp. ZT3P38]|uniref:hypothetical protein n=1 Tax=Parasphingomonas zepuensis TaxID=3096161 RepID=UPI002FCC1247